MKSVPCFLFLLSIFISSSYAEKGHSHSHRKSHLHKPLLSPPLIKFKQEEKKTLLKRKRQSAKDIALGFIKSKRGPLGLTSQELDHVKIKNSFTSRHSGITHFYVRQELGGIEIAKADMQVHVSRAGKIVSAHSRFIQTKGQNLKSKANPEITAEEAVKYLADYLDMDARDWPKIIEQSKAPDRETKLSKGSISKSEISAKLMYVLNENQKLRLAWQLYLDPYDVRYYYKSYVDAFTGEILMLVNMVVNETYEVYPLPNQSPGDGNRALEINPYLHSPSPASPYGWHDTDGVPGPEYTITRGNNVHAYEDSNDDNSSAGNEPDGGAALSFNFPIDLNKEPSTYTDATVVNLFYWNNILHDVHYAYGFDEASGNFQQNNYGKGGAGNDYLMAEAQDGGGYNNANMLTFVDGVKPRMQMYLGNFTTPKRDGSLDHIIIIHEFGHGISIRLTGGAGNSGCLWGNQSGGMGEGWSDWWGLVFTSKPDDKGVDPRTVGTWLLGQSSTGSGIRTYPYSTDMSINPDTYNDILPSDVHRNGSIWCAALWDMYWSLVDAVGFDTNLYSGVGGNNIAMQLVMDGLKLQPCDPTFLNARDAILQAEQNKYGGRYAEVIWKAFARRGMGLSAYDGGSHFSTSIIEGYDIPDFGLKVAATEPAAEKVVSDLLTSFVIHFNHPYDPNSIEAADLEINDIAATSFTHTDSNTVTFSFAVSPIVAEGVQTIQMFSNSVKRLVDTNMLEPFSTTFYYDPNPLEVTTSEPAPFSLAEIPLVTLRVNFNEDFDPTSLNNGDVKLSKGSVTGYTIINSNTVEFALSGLTSEGTLSWTIEEGSVLNSQGIPGLSYSGTFYLDHTEIPFPRNLVPMLPRGSLINDLDVSGSISTSNDKDTFTIQLDNNQTITIIIDPSVSLQPSVNLFTSQGNIASATAPAIGAPAIINAVSTMNSNNNGLYYIEISGSNASKGDYEVEFILNSAVENENYGGGTNELIASAQNIDSSFLNLGDGTVQRGAVLGSAGYLTNRFYYEDFSTGLNGFIIDNTWGTGVTGLWHLSPGRSQDGLPNHSLSNSVYFGVYELPEGGGHYDLGFPLSGTLTSPFISLSPNADYQLRFNHFLEIEPYINEFEELKLQVNDGAGFQTIAATSNGTLPISSDGIWAPFTIDISQFAGKNIQIRFTMEVFDEYENHFEGWYIDDFEIYALLPKEDYFTFYAEKDVTVSLALTAQASVPFMQLELKNESGTTLAQGLPVNNVNELINEFKIPANGYYYALAKGGEVDYSLVITRSAAFESEPNDTISEALDISASDKAIGYLDNSNSQDFYSVDVEANKLLTLQTYTFSDGLYEFQNILDPQLSLYNPSGTLIATDNNSMPDGRNAKLSFITTQAGKYKIKVNLGNNSSGEYLLIVNYGNDLDSDGLPDDWELQYGLNPNDPNDAEVDLDQDNLSNYEEFIADTNPTNDASVLLLNITTKNRTNSLSFFTSKDRIYRIEYKTNLMDEVWSDLIVINPQEDGMFNQDLTNTADRSFYRLGVELP